MVETMAFLGNGKTLKVRGFLAYFLAVSSVAIAAAYFFSHNESQHNSLKQFLSSSPRVWPKLEVNWRIAVATIVGFLGSAFGTVGGVGGGGIFVPLLNLVVGFDTKSAAALSKCMIMGASMSSVWYNLQVPHPIREVPILDYRLALLFQPMLMLGITFGVELSVIFPFWLITILIIILFLGTSSWSFFKGIQRWKHETIIKTEIQEQEVKIKACSGTDCEEPLLPRLQPIKKTRQETFLFNLRWKGILVLMLVWFSFLALQILKNNLQVCSNFYWFVNFLQIPIAVVVFSWQGVKLWKESRERRRCGNSECVCEASVEWTVMQLIFCAFCGLLGGTVGGLLGSGGGFILGPLLLELGVIPQVASATATFVMMFSSSLSVVEFYLLHRFPIPYVGFEKAEIVRYCSWVKNRTRFGSLILMGLGQQTGTLYLISVSVLAGFWGQCLVRKLVKVLGRESVIVFILSSFILASALTMGFVGAIKSITMIHNNEYMGFLDFCNR